MFAPFVLLASLQSATAPSPSSSPPPADRVLIRNSGSTNTQPYTIALASDGSAVVTVGDSAESRHVPQSRTALLFDELRAAMPVAALPAGHCMRSASFGTTTTLAFRGQDSPDLNCPGGPATRELAQTVRAIVDGLDIHVMRVHRPLPQ